MKLDQPLNLDFRVERELLGPAQNRELLPNKQTGHFPISVNNDEVLRGAVEHWLAGNWEHLAKLDNAGLPSTGSRCYLAILAAAGHQHLADSEAETRCVNLAIEWGATKYNVKTILLSGIFNRLGRASVLSEDYVKAVEYFTKAINTTIFSVDKLGKWLEMRVRNQLVDMSAEDLKKTLDVIQSGSK